MASASTGMPSRSPSSHGAPRTLPAGPKTSMRRLASPLTTAGCLVKSLSPLDEPVHLDDPPHVVQAPELLPPRREHGEPTTLAASTASSSVRSFPHWPTISDPSAFRGTGRRRTRVADEDGGVEDARGFVATRPSSSRPSCATRSSGVPSSCQGGLVLSASISGRWRGIVAGGRGRARRGGGGRAAVARRGRRAGAGSTSRAVVVAPVADRAVCPDAAVNMTEGKRDEDVRSGHGGGSAARAEREAECGRGEGIGGVGDGNKDDPSLFLCRASIRECIRRGGDARTLQGGKAGRMIFQIRTFPALPGAPSLTRAGRLARGAGLAVGPRRRGPRPRRRVGLVALASRGCPAFAPVEGKAPPHPRLVEGAPRRFLGPHHRPQRDTSVFLGPFAMRTRSPRPPTPASRSARCARWTRAT